MSSTLLNRSIQSPSSVRVATACLLGSAGLAILIMLAQIMWAGAPAGIGGTLAVGLCTAAYLLFIAVKISMGCNWARWLYLFVYVVGTLLTVPFLLFAPELFRMYPSALYFGTVVQLVVQTTALVLMFVPRSKVWFKAQGVAGAP